MLIIFCRIYQCFVLKQNKQPIILLQAIKKVSTRDMQAKTQKAKQKPYSFYLKIHYNNRTKKFIVRNPKQISLKQIKKSFSPAISAQNLTISIIDNNSRQIITKSEEDLICKLQQIKIGHHNEIHVYIVEEQKSRKNSQFQDQIEIPSGVSKVRSRSQDISLDYKTQAFSISPDQLQATQQFLYSSVILADKKREQAKKVLYLAQKKLIKYKQQQRCTNIDDLMSFLSND